MNRSKSCDRELIPPRLLKESASVILEPLTKIMNCQSRSLSFTLENGTNDEPCKKNYKPVTVLPALNNILNES
ncbi:hypothetical protein pdam_00007976 [Pocillopora damicornis]|uniref:Uncharacterized protein n=1 Tax=Pocillopora damicornis TaxID=46731 RepID=A0A3M6UF26_POCDA|nr:hypothetical protein pdam_00007976 [Pocillopora damicornis]